MDTGSFVSSFIGSFLRYWFYHVVGVFIGFAMIITVGWLALEYLYYFINH